MKFFNQIYQHINILSLDVVAGSVVSALFFSRLLDVTPDALVFFCLALTVWIIYTVDHLRDARSISSPAATDRHRFHQIHFKVIVIILITTIVVNFIIVFFLPPAVIRFGLALGLVVLLYLMFQRYLKFLKEAFVACLYTAGVVLPSLAFFQGSLLSEHYLIIAKFAIMALMNLLLFSLFDLEVDRDQEQQSFVTWFGPAATHYAILFLGVLNIFSGLWLWNFDTRVASIFITMNVLLITVFFLKRQVVPNSYYRMVGDSVFLIPVLYLL